MADQVKSITKKSENISDWYQDVIFQAKLAEHGPSKGSMIIRPYGFSIWESIQRNLDIKIKDLGAENAYFPLLIPLSFLEKEKSHVEGFSPELAIVTHGGGEKLQEPLVVRPTSETIMYDAFSRWIHSFRDLPLKINQWNNVVRWEKRPNLFLRTTEFLWQEGHTAHQTKEQAEEMTRQALGEYINLYQEDLSLFGYAGKKSESEKFAGADETLTYEILMPDGKVIQGCTSHNLGQNFSKVFKVQFQDENGNEEFVHQTSWGFTTRSIGALILAHGDDNGLILPPQIAPIQVIIIPIAPKNMDRSKIEEMSDKVMRMLMEKNVKVRIDMSDNTPGWKFNEYELKGVPIRIEIGNNEAESGNIKLVRRDNKQIFSVPIAELGSKVNEILLEMQSDLFEKSKEMTLENTRSVDTYDQFKEIMETKRGFIKAFWCESEACEKKIKEETKATTRCLPFDSVEEKGDCVYCGQESKNRWLFAQSY